ncbi:hypothetical protein I8748_16450 [Nostoc sp. CENA67]|uniref:Uncharacterized protein n=1 Tax=Amazonocrinis nigriterrae CENA67 TaxID=2794033 RepID=A0A8J7HUN1_9NOST|nr:hypothetical protein [Amazonocrinis nigriterrae]MBH8563762.1 hypothetical protein [Amazonocrinis nigriterrae CENA67]
MVPPTTVSGQAALRELTELSRELKYYADGFKAAKQLKSKYAEIDQIKKGVKTATQSTKDLEKQFNPVKKKVEDAKKTLDNLFKKVPGRDNAEKAAKSGGSLAALLAVGGVAAITAIIAILQDKINSFNIESSEKLNAELSKTQTLAVNAALKAKSIEKELPRINEAIKTNELRANGIEKQLVPIREKANEALYETRQGRKILEGKIEEARKLGNNALYETRAGRTKLEQQIASIQTKVNQSLVAIGQGFQQQINTTIANIQRGLQQAQADNKKLSGDITALQKQPIKNTKIVENLPTIIEKTFAANQLTLKTIVEKIVNPVAKINEKWGVTVTPAVVTPATVTVADTGGVTVTPAVVTPATVRYADFSSSDIGQQVKKIAAAGDENQNKNISTVSSAVGNLSGAISGVAAEARDAKKVAFEALASKNFDPRVDFLTTKIKEVEKVNEEGNKRLGVIDSKLDKIIPTIAGIPIVVGKAADNIIKNIPTPGDIEKATTTGVCRSTQPGGCMNKALNDQSNNINNNTNNNSNNILDAINTGANATQLTLLETINTKLGDLLPGGISGTFARLWQTKQVDRIINILTLITTFHNAGMLSNNILQTLFSGIDNLSQAAGFKWKNEKGEETGFGGLISEWTSNFFKTIFGETTYNNINTTWNAANRTYQSVTNALWNIQGMFDSVRSIGELTVSYTGKIGNALKRGGALFEDAFPDMTEIITARTAAQAKWDAVLQNAQPIEDVVSAFSSVTGEIVSIGDNFNELKNQRDEFFKSKDDGEKAITALITGEKLASQVNQPINSADVQKSDD